MMVVPGSNGPDPAKRWDGLVASKWVDRALVFGILMGGFIAGFSARAYTVVGHEVEPVRTILGICVAIACSFALVERIVNVEKQCSATAQDRDYLQQVVIDLAREALGVPREAPIAGKPQRRSTDRPDPPVRPFSGG